MEMIATALITGATTIIVALIHRQDKRQKRIEESQRAIQENTRKMGNGFTDRLEQRLDAIERNSAVTKSMVHALNQQARRMERRLDEHLEKHEKGKP